MFRREAEPREKSNNVPTSCTNTNACYENKAEGTPSDYPLNSQCHHGNGGQPFRFNCLVISTSRIRPYKKRAAWI